MSYDTILTFTALAKIFLNMRDKEKSNQQDFVARLLWCFSQGDTLMDNYANGKNMGDVLGNKYEISKRLNGKKEFSFSPFIIDKEKWQKRFAEFISTYIDPDKISKEVIFLIYLLKHDFYVNNSKKNLVKKIYGVFFDSLDFTEDFSVCDFLGNTVLYTMQSQVKASTFPDSVNQISEMYNNFDYNFYDGEVIYAFDNQMITIPIIKIYKKFVDLVYKFEIHLFLYRVDATRSIRKIWLERCSEFILSLESEILCCPTNNDIYNDIQAFCLAFKKYYWFLDEELDEITNSKETDEEFEKQLNAFYDLMLKNLHEQRTPSPVQDIDFWFEEFEPNEESAQTDQLSCPDNFEGTKNADSKSLEKTDKKASESEKGSNTLYIFKHMAYFPAFKADLNQHISNCINLMNTIYSKVKKYYLDPSSIFYNTSSIYATDFCTATRRYLDSNRSTYID